MLEGLSGKLEAIFKRLKGKGFLREEDVDAALKEVRLALLEADVNFRVAKDFVARIREKAVGKGVLESLTPGQQVVKIVHGELIELLGGSITRVRLSPNPPTVIMMVGLQGSGKTTTAAKLARLFRREGRRPMLVAADLQRPAAIEQLVTLGSQVEVPVHHAKEASDPALLCEEARKKAVSEGRDILILDTAGRLHIDEALMAELKRIKERARPSETLFVADSMTGQDAVTSAKRFGDEIGIDGIILTKMDGDARGGAALSVKSVTGCPIKFIGVGEKIDMIEAFHPERVASRILGMGDVLSLIEKAQGEFDRKEAERLQEKILSESFSFDDLKEQIKKVRGMGPIENLIGMIPGMNKIKGLKVDEGQFTKIEAVINSMTPKEKRNHNILNASRRRRIAQGSGTSVTDVNRVIKQYVEMKKMLKMFKGGRGKLKLPKFMPF